MSCDVLQDIISADKLRDIQKSIKYTKSVEIELKKISTELIRHAEHYTSTKMLYALPLSKFSASQYDELLSALTTDLKYTVTTCEKNSNYIYISWD